MSVREVFVRPAADIDWKVRMLTNKDGVTPRACSYNIRLVLENDPRWDGVLGACQFSYQIQKLAPPPMANNEKGQWMEEDCADFRHWLAAQYGFEPKTSDIDDAVVVVARNNAFHPVRNYLAGLEWDETQRVETWLIRYLGADDRGENDRYEYLKAVGTKWLIAAVARVMRQPVKADYVLILEGAQRRGKSTALSILGGEWFTDSHFRIGDQDGYQFIRGKWLVELSELDNFNKAESTRAKGFFSSSVDRYRASYGRHARDWPRQCVFAGTTNQTDYLRDATGNTRYWPVACEEGGAINNDGLRVDRDQLWAEATHLYRDGVRWWPTPDEMDVYEDEQDQRFSGDAWEPLIVAWLDDIDATGKRRDQVTTVDILGGALKMEPAQMKPPEQTRVGLIMSRLCWQRERVSMMYDGAKKRRVRVYVRPEESQALDF